MQFISLQSCRGNEEKKNMHHLLSVWRVNGRGERESKWRKWCGQLLHFRVVVRPEHRKERMLINRSVFSRRWNDDFLSLPSSREANFQRQVLISMYFFCGGQSVNIYSFITNCGEKCGKSYAIVFLFFFLLVHKKKGTSWRFWFKRALWSVHLAPITTQYHSLLLYFFSPHTRTSEWNKQTRKQSKTRNQSVCVSKECRLGIPQRSKGHQPFCESVEWRVENTRHSGISPLHTVVAHHPWPTPPFGRNIKKKRNKRKEEIALATFYVPPRLPPLLDDGSTYIHIHIMWERGDDAGVWCASNGNAHIVYPPIHTRSNGEKSLWKNICMLRKRVYSETECCSSTERWTKCRSGLSMRKRVWRRQSGIQPYSKRNEMPGRGAVFVVFVEEMVQTHTHTHRIRDGSGEWSVWALRNSFQWTTW